MILQAISGTCFHLSKISGICFHLSEITISLRFWKLDLGNISLRFLKTCFHLSKISETCFHLSLRLYFSKILNTPGLSSCCCPMAYENHWTFLGDDLSFTETPHTCQRTQSLINNGFNCALNPFLRHSIVRVPRSKILINVPFFR